MPSQHTLTRPSVNKVWDFCGCWTGEAPSKIMDRASDLRKQGGRSGFRTPDLRCERQMWVAELRWNLR